MIRIYIDIHSLFDIFFSHRIAVTPRLTRLNSVGGRNQKSLGRSPGRTQSPWPEEQLLVTSDNPQVIKHGVLETGPFLGDFSIEASIDRGFSSATFDLPVILRECGFGGSHDKLEETALKMIKNSPIYRILNQHEPIQPGNSHPISLHT